MLTQENVHEKEQSNSGRNHYSNGSASCNRSFFLYLNAAGGAAGILFFLLNQYIIKPFTAIPLFHSYLNDAAAGFLLLCYTNFVIYLVRKPAYAAGNVIRIFFFVSAAGIFWEYITPLYRSDSYGDPYDLIAYLCGGLCYLLFLRLSAYLKDRRIIRRFN